MSVLRVILVRIFPHSDWTQRDREYPTAFSPNAGKCGPEWLRMRTLSRSDYFCKSTPSHMFDKVQISPLNMGNGPIFDLQTVLKWANRSRFIVHVSLCCESYFAECILMAAIEHDITINYKRTHRKMMKIGRK